MPTAAPTPLGPEAEASGEHQHAAEVAPVAAGFRPLQLIVGRRRGGRKGRTPHRGWVIVARVGLLVFIIGGWELFTRAGIVDKFFYGQPSGIFDQLKTWVQHGTSQGSLITQIRVTLLEAVYGFVIGVVAGVIFGVALGRVRFLADVFGPYIKVLNSIPRIVLGSVFVVAFGLGSTPKVLLAFVLVFFGVFFNAFQGVREVDRNLVNNARILGASPWKVTTDVILPSAFTWILASLHVSFGFALIGALVGEFLGSSQGLGNLIRTAQGNFNPDGVFAAMVIIAIVALLAEYLISLLERRLLRWRPSQLGGAEL